MSSVRLEPARTAADYELVRELFLEYSRWLGVDLCFQGFEAELATLPGKYAPPGGELLLARSTEGDAVGCVGVRRLDAETCEAKRLWVRPGAREAGTGQRLAEAIIEAARAARYGAMRLDTLRTLGEANRLYAKLGFRPIPAYYDNPHPDVVYYELKLNG